MRVEMLRSVPNRDGGCRLLPETSTFPVVLITVLMLGCFVSGNPFALCSAQPRVTHYLRSGDDLNASVNSHRTKSGAGEVFGVILAIVAGEDAGETFFPTSVGDGHILAGI